MDRQDNARITAEVEDYDGSWRLLGYFEARAGGHSDSTGVVYPLGGIGKPRAALGGRREDQPLTIKRLYDEQAQAVEAFLRGRVGNGNMRVTEQPLNDADEGTGHATTWTGKLKSVGTTDRTMEGAAAEQLELEMIVESVS